MYIGVCSVEFSFYLRNSYVHALRLGVYDASFAVRGMLHVSLCFIGDSFCGIALHRCVFCSSDLAAASQRLLVACTARPTSLSHFSSVMARTLVLSSHLPVLENVWQVFLLFYAPCAETSGDLALSRSWCALLLKITAVSRWSWHFLHISRACALRDAEILWNLARQVWRVVLEGLERFYERWGYLQGGSEGLSLLLRISTTCKGAHNSLRWERGQALLDKED